MAHDNIPSGDLKAGQWIYVSNEPHPMLILNIEKVGIKMKKEIDDYFQRFHHK
ncbi:MAG: hypothetical protein OXE77_01890 [Flavobacteriaceae bacterium]|nr:hypothetical protein [Flavobacteriaceae bacterium]MCY4268503.1 hypothetical protein [Flavobacteriaceae bacterium]